MSYPLATAITDVRRILNDDTENVWTNDNITYFINEGLLIIKNTIPEYFTDLVEVVTGESIVIENVYKNLLVLFASARCFEQDEQDYRASKNMNEFESRLQDMKVTIYSSDAYNTKIASLEPEAVIDDYSTIYNDLD